MKRDPYRLVSSFIGTIYSAIRLLTRVALLDGRYLGTLIEVYLNVLLMMPTKRTPYT